MKNNVVKIGLPKGVIKQKSLSVVKLLMQEEINDKCLSFKNDNYEIYLLKHRDIPKMIEIGLLDIGITASEWIIENKNKVKIISVLDWCNTNICLISAEKKLFLTNGINCITEFYNIAFNYFKKKKILANIFHVSGSSEACVPFLFDCCIDCVETGNTLKENNLHIVETIFESNIVLIGNEKINYDDNIKKALQILNMDVD